MSVIQLQIDSDHERLAKTDNIEATRIAYRMPKIANANLIIAFQHTEDELIKGHLLCKNQSYSCDRMAFPFNLKSNLNFKLTAPNENDIFHLLSAKRISSSSNKMQAC